MTEFKDIRVEDVVRMLHDDNAKLLLQKLRAEMSISRNKWNIDVLVKHYWNKHGPDHKVSMNSDKYMIFDQ